MCASRIATPEKSSADSVADVAASGSVPARAADAALTRRGQLSLLLLNTVPLLHASGVIVMLLAPPWDWAIRLTAALVLLWGVPPLLCRLMLAWSPLTDGSHALGSRGFWVWWASLKLQTLYLRLPFLEEILRLVPGLYSAWLRLWGARVGRLTYWAPGLEITDRPFLEVGDNVVFGGKARIGAHILRRGTEGQLELLVGRVRFGHRCMIGAQSAIGPGAHLHDDEFTHAFFLGRPFTHYRGGRRVADPNPLSPNIPP